MIVPTYSADEIVKEDRFATDAFGSLLRQLLQNLQLSISDEGYWIPSISSQPGSSVTPPDPAQPSQLAVLEASFKTNVVNNSTQTVSVGVQAGTLIFDPYEQNGGVLPARLGQLKVLLNDGTFHAVVNL